jgi:hypothetical protein
MFRMENEKILDLFFRSCLNEKFDTSLGIRRGLTVGILTTGWLLYKTKDDNDFKDWEGKGL